MKANKISQSRGFCDGPKRDLTQGWSTGADPLPWRRACVGLWLICFLLCGGGITRGADLDPVLIGTWPGPFPGHAQAVAVLGNHAFVAYSSGSLKVIDISNPAMPRWVGECKTGEGNQNVVVSANRAYVVGSLWTESNKISCLNLIDISSPTNPQPVGTYVYNGSTEGLVVSGNFAYLSASVLGADDTIGIRLEVVDISNSSNPKRVGGLDGVYSPLALADGHLFSTSWVTSNDTRVLHLQVIDVRNPAKPTRICYDQITAFNNLVSSVIVLDSYLYITFHALENCSGGVVIVDISDPAHPREISQYRTDRCVHSITISEGRAYLAECGCIEAFDVKNPARLVRLGRYRSGITAWNSWGLAAMGNYAFVVSEDSGLQVIDFGKLANPQSVGGFATKGWAESLAVSGQHVYLAESLTWIYSGPDYRSNEVEVIDVINPASPQLVGGYKTNGRVKDLASAGHHLHIEYISVGLEVVDVNTPASLQRVGYLNGNFHRMALYGNYACVVTYDTGDLVMIDITDPSQPKRVSTCGIANQGDELKDLAVSGHYAYIADNAAGLRVIDINDPTHPQQVGMCNVGDYVTSVAVSGNCACVTAGGVSFHVIDISNPADPQWVGECENTSAGDAVAISGKYAYLADKSSGLTVVDVSDPANPKRVGGNSAFGAWDVVADGSRIYVAAGTQGLVILNQFTQPLELSARFEVGELKLSLSGPPDERVRLQRSLDLKTWTDWQTIVLTSQPIQLTDPTATNAPFLFYRAVLLP